MAAHRYLCSELVFVETAEARLVVNLEEIWETGAVIECEGPLEKNARFKLLAGRRTYWVTATTVEMHEFGCRVELEFSPMTRWNAEEYAPQHLLDLRTLGAGEAE